ncbi:Rve-domain-containing hypothetical protein [Phytophthora megakarya]|uniref:Integrase catalytic domain-containing protein n=1 Tax=Phytophthora megakarya TaxID=4795 RepID=A0A225UW24_9STRA|nr:Rve-domain-containing hypothetical protein [Phytophthora megakarya]
MTKKAEVILGSDNYFHWEFAMRMTLARKGLLTHVQVVKNPAEMTDMKALGLIAQGVSVEHHTKIRFDELIIGLQTLGEPLNNSRQLVILLSSLPTEFELIASIVENSKDVTLIESKSGNFGKCSKRYDRKSNNGRRLVGFKGKSIMLDSGATVHMMPHRHDLFEYSAMSKDMYVTIADGKKIRVAETGSVRLTGINGKSIRMEERNSCVIWDKSNAVTSGKKIGKAYVLDCQQDVAYYTEYSGGKQTVTHFPSRSLTTTTRPLDLVHTDVMDTMKTKSKGGARYVLVFVHDYSRYVVAYFLKKKSEVANKTKTYLTMYENRWRERIKCLRLDNGMEFVNKSMDKICQQYGTIHQKAVPYSPQQNGVAERMNRTVMEKAWSMLHYKGVTTPRQLALQCT